MESISSDELEGNLNLSCDEDEAENQRIFVQQRKAQRKKPARKFRQEVDTNVFKIALGTLKNNAEIATGDPIFCKKCNAIFNSNSKVEEKKLEPQQDNEIIQDVERQIWCCEFCNTANEVSIEEGEQPETKAVNYIIEAAAQVQDKKAGGKKDTTSIYIIDMSGSMCCSEPVQGNFKLQGDKKDQMKDLMKFGDGSDQYLQGERNVTYVSRM